MFTRRFLPYVILTIILVGMAAIINSASVGRIEGIVTDSKSGQPVVGATVMVVGTKFGALTDMEGKFAVERLQPGRYELQITHIAYSRVDVIDLAVVADSTTEVKVVMTRRAKDVGKTITVTSDVDVIDKFEGSPQFSPAEREEAKKPAGPVSDLQSQVAPTKRQERVAIRDGQAGGVAYNSAQIDGVQYLRKDKPVACPSPYPPFPGGRTNVNGEPYDAMFFQNYGTNPFVDTRDDNLSTFAIDVDDASYVMARSYLERGHLPPADAVRTEEFVNRFDYRYPQPDRRAFGIHMEMAPSPFGQDLNDCYLLQVGIQGKEILDRDRKPANLTFVIDVSGSMNRENRITLVKQSLELLIDRLTPEDRLGIVVYGSQGRVAMDPVRLDRLGRDRAREVIRQLRASGSTYAEQGIKLGYQMANSMFDHRRINRVILCSDGVANVGQTGPDQILAEIQRYADRGITLTAVGFGMGNYNDVLLEKLGNKGNGQYSYIDDVNEARRFFVENLTGVLQVIARDVKIQVEFDPSIVRSYRLLGYENRDVADNKFRDDSEDGGEIGAGHQVTALYEIKVERTRRGLPKRDLGSVYVRYQDPDTREVVEVKKGIGHRQPHRQWRHGSNDFRLAAAAAEFAEVMRGSYWARGSHLGDVLAMVQEISFEDDHEDVVELERLIREAMRFDDELVQRDW